VSQSVREVIWVAIHRPGREAPSRQTELDRGKGTFVRKSEAQRAINEAYEIAATPDTLGEYFATGIERHPRSERTSATYEHRVSRVTDVEIEGIALTDWPMHELRRRHTLALVDHMLTKVEPPPNGDDCQLLFTIPTGRLWRERTSIAISGGRLKKPRV
jgi:hypothetical protein